MVAGEGRLHNRSETREISRAALFRYPLTPFGKNAVPQQGRLLAAIPLDRSRQVQYPPRFVARRVIAGPLVLPDYGLSFISSGVLKMARRCELTGVGPMSGNNVSHANNKTKRRFLPNLCNVTLHSDKLGRGFKMRITAAALRTVDHAGGFDAFLAKADEGALSSSALKIKRELAKAS